MSRLRIALAALAVAVGLTTPAAAQATVDATNITTWTSSDSGTPSNSSYLVSYDNAPTTLTVTGSAPGAANGDKVDIVCYYGSPSVYKVLASNLSISNGAFNTGGTPPQLRQIAGHACRLRAVPTGHESTDDSSQFSGPQVAIGETALLPTIAGGPNNGDSYNFYVNPVTFSGFAAWKAAGTGGCGPYAAPIDSAFDIGSFPIDCAGSLLSDDLGIWGGRSEVEVDGRSAYDAPSAQGLFARSNGLYNGSEDLSGFPSLHVNVTWDPTTGLMASQSQEQWVSCTGSDPYQPTSILDCPSFEDTGVQLERDVTASDGGRVITLTDTWSSTDGQSHSLDLLYDDYAGVYGSATGERGWEFPGQSGFTQYGTADSVPAPSTGPGSILVRTNVTADDGDPSEGTGAITFSRPPTGLRFASNNELEEHQVLTVPAGGSTSLSYIYSVGYSVADANGLALDAQDRFQPPAVSIASPGGGSTVSTSSVPLTGTAAAGSGIKSVDVGGQTVPVDSAGVWSAQVPLNPGSNTITALATDGAGASAQAQVTVVYQPPAPVTSPPATCKVPRLKGMKLAKAEKALRKAHCRVGKIKRVKSRKVGRDRVISTSPPAGRRERANSKVELYVANGS